MFYQSTARRQEGDEMKTTPEQRQLKRMNDHPLVMLSFANKRISALEAAHEAEKEHDELTREGYEAKIGILTKRLAEAEALLLLTWKTYMAHPMGLAAYLTKYGLLAPSGLAETGGNAEGE